MPLIHVFHNSQSINDQIALCSICEHVASKTNIPSERVWLLWHHIDEALVRHPHWVRGQVCPPIVRIFCRASHPSRIISAMVAAVRDSLGSVIGCAASAIFVQVIRVADEDVYNAV
jgi:hypothetical protein